MRPDPLALAVGSALMLAGFGGALAVWLLTRPRRYEAPHHRFKNWYGDRFRAAGTDGARLRMELPR